MKAYQEAELIDTPSRRILDLYLLNLKIIDLK